MGKLRNALDKRAAGPSTYRPHPGGEGSNFNKGVAEKLYWEYVAGDEKAAQELLMEVQKLAVACCRSEFTNTARDEEDHVQHALMIAWKAITRKRVKKKGKFRSYIYTVLKRAIYDSIYQQHRAVQSIDYHGDLVNAGLDPADNHCYQNRIDDADMSEHVFHVLNNASLKYRFPDDVKVYFAVIECFRDKGKVPSFKDAQRKMNIWRPTDVRLYMKWFAAVVLVNRLLAKIQQEIFND